MLTIEMCRILHSNRKTQVLGIILIDTPYTQHWSALGPEVIRYEPQVKSQSPWVCQGVKRRFEVADDLVKKWQFPSIADLERWEYDPQASTEDSYKFYTADTTGRPTGVDGMAKLKFDQNFTTSMRLQQLKGYLPPALLLRATDTVLNGSTTEELHLRIDLDRDYHRLGWEQCPIKFISVVQDIPGNHYNMFEGDDKVVDIQTIIHITFMEQNLTL